MTCYDILVQIAQNGTDKIHIDLCNKTLKVGKQKVIENGQVVKNKIFNNEFVENALLPIDETVDGIIIDVITVWENAFEPIEVIPPQF